jgi:diguanylate cyclase (GGDEF)-like protein
MGEALVLDVGARQHVEFRVVGTEDRWVGASFVPLGEPGQPAGWLATLDDVTDHRRTRVQLTHQATHDPLTRLPNRALLHDRLALAGARLSRTPHHGVVGVLFIDLDDFKGINDTYGHAAGDQVLAELGRRLAETVRETDLVARFGGDEFVVVCEAGSTDELDPLLARIHTAVTAPIDVTVSAVEVGATIGLATTSVALEDMTELLERADRAMYQAKPRS